ncbi:hypothetical protein [Consotaella salsifontis]|uniref:hypothetical protein n=1 Tax=Consotaella salsifontis TaxID=1365950 RepID=UPI00105442C0|nr:hypothetical protein [Consotaella salsifontis]
MPEPVEMGEAPVGFFRAFRFPSIQGSDRHQQNRSRMARIEIFHIDCRMGLIFHICIRRQKLEDADDLHASAAERRG